MALKTPRLDDRQFQDIVDEAKKRISHYCPGWTDHNVSDPGVTLIELFAWMTDMILYRLNQVPELHYIKMMEMLGMNFPDPVPVKVPVTFWLSKPQENACVIPSGTEVATTQTETQPSLIFTTDQDFHIQPVQWEAVVLRRVTEDRKMVYEPLMLKHVETGWSDGFDVFSKPPRKNEALYFGFKNDLSHHVLVFDMELTYAGARGYDAEKSLPYVWEATTGKRNPHWEKCDCDPGGDTTYGLNQNGRIEIHLPKMGKYAVPGQDLYWVRLRYEPTEQVYGTSPRLRKATVHSWGGTSIVTYARRVEWEHLGQSDGSPGQQFQLQHTPILKCGLDEALIVRGDGELDQVWQEVPDFADSEAQHPHYMLDNYTGELRLGPAVRQPNGDIKLYGKIPPRGANLFFSRYHYSPELEDTVQIGDINTLKTSIAYIDRIKNRARIENKCDKESLESLKLRAPQLLRSSGRAVTDRDFELLVEQASREGVCTSIGRVKCLPTAEGTEGLVHILAIPAVSNPARYLTSEELTLEDEDKQALRAYLNERRLLTTRLQIDEPTYRQVTVKVRAKAASEEDRDRVRAEIEARLYRFLNPLKGGHDQKGWPFDQTLYKADIYPSLQGIPGMLFVQHVELYDERDRQVEYVDLPRHCLIISGIHQVEFVR
ncbi:MAG: putative baseplate assembly protein [Anaerolineae bacterium]|nr:putative baseplate assembly protein [Anaerolineae bacterium]